LFSIQTPVGKASLGSISAMAQLARPVFHNMPLDMS
jgi:hypothetical protein